MLKEFSFLSVQEIHFGFGTIGLVGESCKKLKLSSVLIVSDKFMVNSGMVKKLGDILSQDNINYSVFSEFDASPSISQVEKAYEVMKEKGCQGVIGYGGGSSLDTAKAIAILLNNPPPIAQYFGIDQVPNRGCPMIMIPTTAGTGSEVSDACIIRNDISQLKSGVRSKFLLADIALVDPELTVSMPPRLTAATGMDALTHCIEGYVSNGSSIMTRLYHREAIKLIFKYLRTAVGNGNDKEARYNVMLGSMYAGWAMAVSSLGACHAMAYPIEGKYHVPHGEANASLLTAVMRYNALGNLELFKEMAIAMGENIEGLTTREAAYKAVEAVELLKKDIGIPTISEFGVVESDLQEFAEAVIKNTRLLGYNPRQVTVEAIKSIYIDAM